MPKRIPTIVLAALFIFTLPGIAQADPLEPVTVLWDRTGVENLPCPNGAHWTFDQGLVEGLGIYNTTIHLGPDGYAGWGMGFDWTVYPRTFAVDTVFPLDAETYVDYSYTSEESAEFRADDHLVLESCLPPDTCPVELAELKARFATAQERVRMLEDAIGRALAVLRGNAASRVRAMREILRAALT